MSTQKQLKYDKAYLKMALEWGKLSFCKRKQVGAIIVKDRMIISIIIGGHKLKLWTQDFLDTKNPKGTFIQASFYAQSQSIITMY